MSVPLWTWYLLLGISKNSAQIFASTQGWSVLILVVNVQGHGDLTESCFALWMWERILSNWQKYSVSLFSCFQVWPLVDVQWLRLDVALHPWRQHKYLVQQTDAGCNILIPLSRACFFVNSTSTAMLYLLLYTNLTAILNEDLYKLFVLHHH